MFKRKYLLIYIIWSSSHLLMISFLYLLSLNILSLHADISDSKHQDNIKYFNDLNSDVNAMISSISANDISIKHRRKLSIRGDIIQPAVIKMH